MLTNSSVDISSFFTSLALKGVELQLVEEKIVCKQGEYKLSDLDRKLLENEKEAIGDALKSSRGFTPKMPELARYDLDRAYLHYRQRNWWKAVGSGNGFSGIGYRPDFFYEDVDLAVMQEAWNILVRRHDILSLGIAKDGDGVIYQYIRDDLHHKVEYFDLTQPNLGDMIALNAKDGDLHSELRRYLKAYGDTDVEETILNTDKPLYRLAVLKTDEKRFEIAFYIDHLISDGISISLIFSELKGCYAALLKDLSPQFPVLPYRYIDYVNWHNNVYSSESLWYQREKSYWIDYYNQIKPALIPNDPNAKPESDGSCRTTFICLGLGKAQTANIKRTAEENRLTLFNMLLGMAFQTLAEYLNTDHVTVATIMSGRYLPGVINLPGSFAEILFVGNTVTEDEDYIAVGKKVGRQLMKLQIRQNIDSTPFLPLGVSSIDSRAGSIAGSSLIFTGEFYRELCDEDDSRFDNEKITKYFLSNDPTLTPKLFWIRAFESKHQLRLDFSYDTARHSEPQIARLVNIFRGLLMKAAGETLATVVETDITL